MLQRHTQFSRYLKSYYSIAWLRTVIKFIYVLNQILLALYLLFIPIQVAYYWLLSNKQNSHIQTKIDITVLVLFSIHILLYFDDQMHEVLKNPYTIIWRKIITVELLYDLFTFLLAIYALSIVNKSETERIVEIVFFFKIYKLFKFDLKAMYFVIGTSFYVPYKIVRTLLIVFVAIAYFGSLFYGVAYLLYTKQVNVDMLWIHSCPAINDCVQQPFIIQLEYAMYWALGTASTAAYGDISATEPNVVIVNIIALAFQGFLFGFYLNSMHSIPQQNKKKQADLLQKFDSFQQHSSDRKLSKKLYLQILCSLEYSQSQKRSIESIEKLMPKKYIQEIKYSMYSDLLTGLEGIFIGSKRPPDQLILEGQTVKHSDSRQQQLRLEISYIVKQTVCEINEDVYKYMNVSRDDILFVHEGQVRVFLSDQLEFITQMQCKQGDYFGVFSFATGLRIPEKAICTNYSVIYSLSRSQFKACLNEIQKFEFHQQFNKFINMQSPPPFHQPITNYLHLLQFNNQSHLTFNNDRKYQMIMRRYNMKEQQQRWLPRAPTKSKKVMRYQRKYRHQYAQTESMEQDPLLQIETYSMIDCRY